MVTSRRFPGIVSSASRFIVLVIALLALPAAISRAGNLTAGPVTVPGSANPWLAGAATGATAAGGDTLANAGPVLVSGLTFGSRDVISFAVTGSVDHTGSAPSLPPDGDISSATNHNPENGIGSIQYCNYDSLVGVFLSGATPAHGVTDQAPGLDFSGSGNGGQYVGGGAGYRYLTPALGQPFFIGDGLDGQGNPQLVAVPAGATRLYLGTQDVSAWANNTGSFSVQITGTPGGAPAEANPATFATPVQFTDGGQTVVKVVGSFNFPVLNQGNDTGADFPVPIFIGGATSPAVVTADYAQKLLHIRVAGDDGVSFTTHDITTAGNPTDLAVADLDGDGHLDLVTCENGKLVVYLNTGGFTFAAPVSYTALDGSSNPITLTKLAVVDVDNDHLNDLVGVGATTLMVGGAVRQTMQVAVFLNAVHTQPGTFLPASVYHYANASGDLVVAGNLTRQGGVLDPYPEIVVGSNNGAGSFGAAQIVTFLNKGDGTFGSDDDADSAARPKSVTIFDHLHALALGDVTHDGNRDAVVLASSGGSHQTYVYILPGVGDGSFDESSRGFGFIGSNSQDVPFPGSIALGDFDNNGYLDVALTDPLNTGGILVWTFDGEQVLKNSFFSTNKTAVATAAGAGAISLEGSYTSSKPNLVVANSDTNCFTLLPNTYSVPLSPTTFTVNGLSTKSVVAPGATLHFEAMQSATATGLAVRVQASATPLSEPSWTDLSDGNSGVMSPGATAGDYVLDSTAYPPGSAISFRAIAYASGSTDSISNIVGPFNLVPGPTLNPVSFQAALNLGSGSYFPVRVVASITHPDPNDLTRDVIDPIDFNGDGISDFAYVEGGTGHTVTVWLRQLNGSYQNVQFAAPDVITDLAVGDVNGDGLPDLIVAAGGKVLVYTNDGVIVHSGEQTARLSFTLEVTLSSAGDTLQRVAVGDLNGDGIPEIVATSTTAGAGHVVVFAYDASVPGYKPTVYTVPFGVAGAGALAIGPLSGGDPIPDVVVADPTGTSVVVLAGNGDGTLSVATNAAKQLPLTHTAVAIAIGDLDGDGQRDLWTAGYSFGPVNGASANQISVDFLHNNGAGFDAASSALVASSPSASGNAVATDLTLGDFNLDGTLDVAVADSFNGGVRIVLTSVFRDVNGNYTGSSLAAPVSVAAGGHTETVSAGFIDSDTRIDLVAGNNDSTDVSVILNAGAQAPPVLSGRKVEFASATYTVHEGTDPTAVVTVKRASDSPGSILVPFTIAGTAIRSPKAHSDYTLDFPSTQRVEFADGEFEKQIQFSISSDPGAQPDATIIVTLGKPTTLLGKPTLNAVLGTVKATTITIIDSQTPTIHAANALTVTPSNFVTKVAATLHQLMVKADAYTSSPWTFSASQTADKTAPGLAMKVQFSPTPTGPWVDFPHNDMHPIKKGSVVWSTTSSDVFSCAKAYFRTQTSATDYSPQSGAGIPVGAYRVEAGPRLVLSAQQCPFPLASNLNNFTQGEIATHNSEGITYDFVLTNTGTGPATNVTIDIPLSPLTHFSTATVPHLTGQLIQLDRKGNPTSSNPDTVALRYTYPTLAAGATDYIDVVVDVLSANEYNSRVASASFGLKVSLGNYRIATKDQHLTVDGTPAHLTAVISSPLAVRVDHDKNVASPGETILYTGVIENTAAVDYKEAVFTAALPIGVALENVATLDAASGNFSGGTINPTGATNPSVAPYPFLFGDGQTLTWQIGTVPAGKTRTVQFTGRILYDVPPEVIGSDGAPHTNEVDLTNYNLTAAPPTGGAIKAFGHNDDGVPARVLISAANPGALPQIGFVKEATGLGNGGGELTEDGLAVATVLPRDAVQYTLHYFNTGGSTARGCVIQEQIASNGTFVGFMNLNGQDFAFNQYVLKDAGGTVLPRPNHTIAQDLTLAKIIEFHLGDVAAGDEGYLSYRVAATAPAGHYLVSKGYRMYTESLSQAVPGKPDQVPAKVVLPISFDINTKANKFEVSPGEQITYTVRFRNNGGVNAKNLVVSCVVPVGSTYVSGRFCDESLNTVATGTVLPPSAANGQTVSFQLATLAPEEGFTDLNGNGYHDQGEPYTDGSDSHHMDAGEGIVQFTVQVLSPLPLALRVPNTMLATQASITGHYPSGAGAGLVAGRQPKSARFTADAPLLLGQVALDPAYTRIKDPLRANLWAMKTAAQFVTKGQEMVYNLVVGNSGNVAVNDVKAAIQVPFGTTLDTANTSPGYKLAGTIVTWTLGDVPPHTAQARALVVRVKRDSSYQKDTLEENSCSVTAANAPECVPGASRTTVLSTNPAVSAWQSFCAWLGSLGGNLAGHGSTAVQDGVHNLNDGTIQTNIRGVDIIVMHNGAVLIQNGGGQIVAAGAGNIVSAGAGNIVAAGAGNIVAAGGGNIVAAGGGNIVAAGAGNIVAAGAGNAISVASVGFLTQANLTNLVSAIVAAGGGNIVAAGGGNIVAAGGGNLIGQDGTSLIGLDGSPIVAAGGGNFKITPQTPGIVAAGAGNIVAAGAGNIVAAGAGNIVAAGAGNLIATGTASVAIVNPNGAGIVAAGAGNIVSAGAGNIVSAGAGNIVSAGAGNIVSAGAGN